MDTPFSVIFIENKRKKIVCDHFCQQSDFDYLSTAAELMENTNLSLIFEAPPGYILYMDGIDNLPGVQVFDDEKGTFVKPMDSPYELYNYDSSKSPYPFIPGTYFLTVITPEGKEYDARIKVVAKQVNEDQHRQMVFDIESFLTGLSLDFSEKRSNNYTQAAEVFGKQKVEKYSFLLQHKNKIINGLKDISKTRRYSIQKSYPIVVKAQAKRVDHRSMRYLITHPEQQSTIQTPQSVITYQTNENSWLKHIVLQILKYTSDMKRKCEVNPSEKFGHLTKEVNDLHFHLLQFLNEKWMVEIKKEVSNPIPQAFFTLGNYNLFYKAYRFLNEDEMKVESRFSKQFHYKRSDILYEIWAYLKVAEVMMKREGFEMKNNWFKTNRISLDEMIVPNSTGYDVIELQKENVVVRLFYDEVLPKAKKDVNAYRTLYTLHHNRPDCRIDVWKDGTFRGSLVIDFKYRKRYSLWDDQLLSRGKEASKVMKQLESYTAGMKTNTFILNNMRDAQLDRNPVAEAWAVYPQEVAKEENYQPNDFDIRLIDLTPGRRQDHFEELLGGYLKRMLEQ